MKAVQIDRYSKEIKVNVRDLPVPEIGTEEVLVKVKTAAVNPLEILNITGAVKLVQDYSFPLTLGNELVGVVEQVGANVSKFQIGDRVFARMPLTKIGAFAEYAAVHENALALVPEEYDDMTAVAIPLTGLTAYQAITEELKAKPGETLLIPGGSGSFGQIAVPIAKALGLKVIVTGNDRAKDKILALGADQYIDYRKENYWETVSDVDYVIDTLGDKEIGRELSVMKKGGRLVSLRALPNKQFAVDHNMSALKRTLFAVAGGKFDRMAKKQGKEYRFLFVREDGEQLKTVASILAEGHIVPEIDERVFTLDRAEEAIQLVQNGRTNGKVVLKVD